MMGRGRRMRRRRVVAVGAVAGTAGYAMGRKGGKKAAEEQAPPAQAPAQAAPPAAQPAAPPGDDYAAELQKLASLKEQGILTEEEFQAKKKQVLGI